MKLFEPSQRIDPAHARHQEIQQDHIRVKCTHQRHSLFSAIDGPDFIALHRKILVQQVADFLFVIDDEELARLTRLVGSLRLFHLRHLPSPETLLCPRTMGTINEIDRWLV